MKEHEAYEVLSRLTTTCGTWDDDNVSAWVELLMDLEHVQAAHEATKTTIQSWKKPQRPPYGIWLDAYKSALARGFLDEQRVLSAPKGTEVTLPEHLDWLLMRNDLTELGVWAHHASKWRVTDRDVRIAGQAAIPWSSGLTKWFDDHPNWSEGAAAAHQGEQRSFFRPKRPIGEFMRDPEEER